MVIWAVFAVDYIARLFLAPRRGLLSAHPRLPCVPGSSPNLSGPLPPSTVAVGADHGGCPTSQATVTSGRAHGKDDTLHRHCDRIVVVWRHPGVLERCPRYGRKTPAGKVTRRQVLAVLIIGANDLTHQIPPDEAAGNVGAAVRRLRDARAEVVVAPEPDLRIVPHVPASLRPRVHDRSELLRARQIKAVQEAGGRVADEDAATSVAFAADRSLFSGDAFHPSGAGYRVIVEALLPVVLAAAGLPAAEH